MSPADFIDQSVKSGQDVIFAENHAIMHHTFRLMSDAIKANPAGVGAISLELPVEIQEVLDEAATGTLDRETFIRQGRIAMEHSAMDAAYNLLAEGIISDERYEAIVDKGNSRVNDVISRTNGDYSAEDQIEDENILGALHELAETAGHYGVPILANDVDREYIITRQFEDLLTLDSLHQRYDDRSDHNLLESQVDLETVGPILVHRGVHHVHDVGGLNNGIDDTLERAGRSVVTVGHYPSQEVLDETMRSFDLPDDGLSFLARVFNFEASGELGLLADPTDYTIVDEQLYDASDVAVHRSPDMNGPALP